MKQMEQEIQKEREEREKVVEELQSAISKEVIHPMTIEEFHNVDHMHYLPLNINQEMSVNDQV